MRYGSFRKNHQARVRIHKREKQGGGEKKFVVTNEKGSVSCRGRTTGDRYGNIGGCSPSVRISTPRHSSRSRHSITGIIPPIDGHLRGRERRWRKSRNRPGGGILWQDGRNTTTRDRGRRPRVRGTNSRGDISSTLTTRLPWKVGSGKVSSHTEGSALALRLAWVCGHPTVLETKLIGPEGSSNRPVLQGTDLIKTIRI